MEDMKKLAEEQLDGVTGGAVVMKWWSDPAYQEKLLGVKDSELKTLLGGLSQDNLKTLLGGIQNDALRAKLHQFIL